MSNLKNIRKSKKLTQAKLSEVSGVNLRTLQDYEQGHKDINKAEAMTVYKLAQALECNVEDLLGADIARKDKLTDHELSDIFFYCYLLSKLVSPRDAEKEFNLSFDGAVGDTLRELSSLYDKGGNIKDLKKDELYGSIFDQMISDVHKLLSE